jgi:hypothetical protein
MVSRRLLTASFTLLALELLVAGRWADLALAVALFCEAAYRLHRNDPTWRVRALLRRLEVSTFEPGSIGIGRSLAGVDEGRNDGI